MIAQTISDDLLGCHRCDRYEAPQLASYLSPMAGMHALDVGRWNTFIIVFLVIGLTLACAVLLPVILSKHLHRLNTWIAFIFSLIGFCLTFLSSPISGHGGTVPPPFALCLFQASLSCAAYPFVASAGACFMFEIYYMIYISLRRQPRSRWIHSLLLIPPLTYILLFSFAVSIGVREPERVVVTSAADGVDVTRFCNVDSPALSYAATTYIAIAVSGMALASAYAIALVYSNWCDYRALAVAQESQCSSIYSLSVLVRLALFFIVIAVSLSLDLLRPLLGTTPMGRFTEDVILVALPLATVLIFGTQRDIMKTWARWLRIL